MSVNFTPYIANQLNTLCTEHHTVMGAYVTKKDDEVYTSALVSQPDGSVRLLVFLNDGDEETVNTNYLLKSKPLTVKNASTRFLTSVQMLSKWIEALLTAGKITVSDVVFDAEDTTKVIALHQSAIITLFMSRTQAAPRGRSSSQNVLVLDFGKGKRASTLKAAIAALLSANDYIATVYDAKEYAQKRKDDRAAKVASK